MGRDWCGATPISRPYRPQIPHLTTTTQPDDPARWAGLRDIGPLGLTLEAAWIAAAQGDDRKARETIDAVPEQHPFEAKYNQIASINWESCSAVLNRVAAKEALERGW